MLIGCIALVNARVHLREFLILVVMCLGKRIHAVTPSVDSELSLFGFSPGVGAI